MTVRPEVILSRLAHLARALIQLERLLRLPESERRDPLNVLALERALQLAAEAIFDIGHHVLAGRGHAIAAHYREVLPALSEAGALPRAVAVGLEGLAGLRNLLVHGCADVDPVRLWALADTRRDDLSAAHAALAALPELEHARG
jgi:uncharacterized protein YutE (UPF0331/DUF86 family)